MLDVIHAHLQEKHENIWPEGLAIILKGNCDFSNTDGPCHQKTWCRTDYHARPTNKFRSLYLLLRYGFFRTTYEQASRDDFFKIPKPRTDSPLSLLSDKLSNFKALKLPSSDGTGPAHATEALNKNRRLDLRICQLKSNDRLRRWRIQCLDYKIAHRV